MNFLFVCTGNTCRSPMAQVIAEADLEKRGKTDSTVKSAGIFAGGARANPFAIAAIEEIDPAAAERLRKHKAAQITAELIDWADHILVMSEGHALAIAEMMSLEAAENLKLKEKITIMNVPDPYGGNSELYEKTRDWLISLIGEFFDDVFADFDKLEEN